MMFVKLSHKITVFLLMLIPLAVSCSAEDLKQKEVVEAKSGQNFKIILESNTTTGYGWQLAGQFDEKAVRLVRSDYLPYKTELVGVGGRQVWVFEALRPGKTELYFKYVRPWEKDKPPARERSIAIIIR